MTAGNGKKRQEWFKLISHLKLVVHVNEPVNEDGSHLTGDISLHSTNHS
jgi:hypothetical protein